MPEMGTSLSSLNRSLETLRKLSPARKAVVRCELCSQPLAAEHQHLLEIVPNRLLCVCDACAVLFPGETPDAKYRRVPRRIRFLADFQLDEMLWNGLLIPINMAFFFRSTPRGRAIAFYPGPAGATESLLELDAWNDIVSQNPILQSIEPDVEALLVNRIGRFGDHGQTNGATEPRYFLVPIDECYKLVGVIRANWRGLSGGKKVWDEIDNYFIGLKSRSQTVSQSEKPGLKQCPI
jgi:uncharacterized protein DUF5947